MALKHVPLFALVLLGFAVTFPGVANAEEGDESQCQTQACYTGVDSSGKCKTYADFTCNSVCVDNGCDGGSATSGSFTCGGVGPWKVCQCNYCGGGGGGTGGGGGGTGGGSTCNEFDCSMACFEEFACLEFVSYCWADECWCELVEMN